ncbi:MAG: hypothetical protein CM1200mP5_6910 [Candidatus Pelagibacterales bacterium]|nr:MAG: hypothetical protein CM1200mP5_6910 [Pelagibacterales bacterium]
MDKMDCKSTNSFWGKRKSWWYYNLQQCFKVAQAADKLLGKKLITKQTGPQGKNFS